MGKNNEVDQAMLSCAIIAGGRASRMLPLTADTPKVLLPLAGRPLLDHQLSWLESQGVPRVVLCVGHLADKIADYLQRSGWSDRVSIHISTEGEQRLGTAGAIRLAISRGLLTEQFVTVYGDCLPSMDLALAVQQWSLSGLPGLLAVHRTTGVDRASVALSGKRANSFIREPSQAEAAKLTHGDYGLAGFRPDLFTHLEVGARAGFAEIHSRLASDGRLFAFEVAGGPREIGSISGYAELERQLAIGSSPAD